MTVAAASRHRHDTAGGPDGVRLPRLVGLHCSAGVVALVLGISWAVRANAGKSVPAWVPSEGTVPLSDHERRQLE